MVWVWDAVKPFPVGIPFPCLEAGQGDHGHHLSSHSAQRKSGATLLKHGDVLLLGEVGPVTGSMGGLGWRAGEHSSPCLLLISTTALPWDH